MKMIPRETRYWIYRKIYGLPHPDEIWEISIEKCPEEWNMLSDRAKEISSLYMWGWYTDIKGLADAFEIPRERVRQILWKVWRLDKK